MSKYEEKASENEALEEKNRAEGTGNMAENKANEGQEAGEGCESALENSAAAENSGENGKEEAAELTMDEKIVELEVQLAESRDQLLRKAADFENFRKRMNQEKQSAIEYANQSLLLDIIPIIDDFERAIIAGESSTDYASFLEGIKMIEKRLVSQLEAKWGLKRFDSEGEPFDPNMHEALYMEKSAEVSDATVQEDLFKGYTLKGRVIRAAKVKVLMPENE